MTKQRFDPADMTVNGSSLGRYFKDVARFHLLTPEEERRVARDLERAEIVCWVTMLGSQDEARNLVHHLVAVIERPRGGDEEIVRGADQELARCLADFRQCLRADSAQWNIVSAEFAVRLRSFDFDKSLMCDMKNAVASSQDRVYVDRVLHAFRLRSQVRDAFVHANLRLVLSVARRYLALGRLTMSDLVQEGNCGLLLAVDRFNYHRGYRFITYASWWIRHAILKAISDRGRMIRLPIHVLEMMHQITKLQQDHLTQFGCECAPEELARTLDCSLEKVYQVLDYIHVDASSSLDRSISEDLGSTLLDLVCDEEGESSHDVLQKKEEAAHALRLLQKLSYREQEVLRMRFGLSAEGGVWTLQEIADRYGVSRERVRQIEWRALKRLRQGG